MIIVYKDGKRYKEYPGDIRSMKEVAYIFELLTGENSVEYFIDNFNHITNENPYENYLRTMGFTLQTY